MGRTINLGVLEKVRIASPCPARWEEMVGDEKTRHCARCDRSVHNLSAMSRAEADELIRASQGQFCAGFFRRADGTILTRDCPVGLRRAHRAMIGLVSKVAAVLGAVVSGAAFLGASGRSTKLASLEPFATLRAWVSPGARVTGNTPFILGKLAAPTPPGANPPNDQGPS